MDGCRRQSQRNRVERRRFCRSVTSRGAARDKQVVLKSQYASTNIPWTPQTFSGVIPCDLRREELTRLINMTEILTVSITPGEGDEIDCREKGKAALRIVDSRHARNTPLHGLCFVEHILPRESSFCVLLFKVHSTSDDYTFVRISTGARGLGRSCVLMSA
jgi:hypothetical protein